MADLDEGGAVALQIFCITERQGCLHQSNRGVGHDFEHLRHGIAGFVELPERRAKPGPGEAPEARATRLSEMGNSKMGTHKNGYP